MRMTLYYLLHTFKNQVRKLFRTWIVIFFGVCILVGLVFGIGAGVLFSAVEDNLPESSDTASPDEEEFPEEEFPEEEFPEEAPWDATQTAAVLELIIGGVVLGGFVLNLLTADKSGGNIFLMADVNLLFSSPRRPQSVLLFRLLSQMGTSLLASVWIVFQIPNLLNSGVPAYAVPALLLAWLLLLVTDKLILVWCYTLTATYERLKKWIRPVVYGLVGVVGGSFLLYWRMTGGDAFAAACRFFNAPVTRYIPLWGWLKGAAMGVIEGQPLAACLYLLLLLVTLALIAWAIWRFPADFYEDALARAEEMDTARRAAAESNKGVAVVNARKKERSDRIRRAGFGRGQGAAMYFHKAMYNRFRFAYLRVFTKTSLTYLVTAVAVCAVVWFGFEERTALPALLVLAGFVFFRSLGNPLAQDVARVYYRLIPESPYAKVLYSLLGGTVNCLLDLIPAYLVTAIWMGASPLTAVLVLLLTVSIDLYSSCVGAFIDLSLPTTLVDKLRQLIQVLFVYFGLAPTLVLLVIGLIVNLLPLFLGCAILCNLMIAGVLYAFIPLFLLHGQK